MRTLLQINSVVNSGSTGRIAEDIGQLAVSKGWNSYIAYGRNERPSKSNLIKIGTDWDVKMHGMQTRLFDNHGFASKKATRKFIKEVERIKPSIIHLHNIHGYYINIEILFNYLVKTNIPVIWTLHDCWSFTGHCAYFSFAGCDKWRTQCFECPLKSSYPASLLIDNSKRNYNKKKGLFNSVQDLTLVPVSYWLGELVEESFLNRYPMKVIQNGIDINTFSIKETENIRAKYNLKDRFVILGVAGIWDKRKGLDDFIKLYHQIDENEAIVLVGLSSDQIKTLPKDIIGIERTESVEELAQLYSMADVYFNASVEETFGLTTVEAFACGTPAIVYNKTAVPEVIDKKVGWIVKDGDIDAIVDIVRSMQSEPKNIKEQRKLDCREKAERLYNKDDRFEEYFDLYAQLINK